MNGPAQDATHGAEAETNTEPTEAQKEAGNYKKGHVRIDGYDINGVRQNGDAYSNMDGQEQPTTGSFGPIYTQFKGKGSDCFPSRLSSHP